MNTELENQLNALIGKISNKEDFELVKDQLLKRGVESLLKAEMTAHLGYEKGSSAVDQNLRNGAVPESNELDQAKVENDGHERLEELETTSQTTKANGVSREVSENIGNPMAKFLYDPRSFGPSKDILLRKRIV